MGAHLAVFKRSGGRGDEGDVALPRHQTLRQKASLAMRSGDFASALRIYGELERLEPSDPTWPERQAGACHELGRTDQELACLRRSLELLVDQLQVLPAIATCKLILDIAPDDPETLDRLHLLYSEPSVRAESVEPGRHRASPTMGVPSDHDAPLTELELTDMIPEARAIRLGDGDGHGVAEIPLGGDSGEWTGSDDLDVDIVDEVRAIGEPGVVAPPQAPRAAVTPPPVSASEDGAKLARTELSRTPLFGSLDVTTMHRLVSQVDVVRLDAGETLFREGDHADTLYVVVDGAVVPIAEGPPRTRMAVLEKGAFFGEIGLVTNQPRTATIEALVDTRLLGIGRKVMWSLIRERSDVSKILLGFLRERLVDRTMRTHPFFAPFASADLEALGGQFRFLEIQDEAPVVEQGLPSDGLFVLLAGDMDVVDEEADKDIDHLLPGDVFGGVPLIRGEPAAASVFAVGKCWVLVLEAARLRRILAGRPRLEDELVARLDFRGEAGPIV